jgi:hypothetical protein
MAGNSSFLGTSTGQGVFVQTTYPNQMGTALPGDLAYASDRGLLDSLAVADTNGVYCGHACWLLDSPTYNRPGVGDIAVVSASFQGQTMSAKNFAGVVCRGQAGYCDANGVPFWPYERMAPIARPERAGCRVYVEIPETIAVSRFDTVYAIISGANVDMFSNVSTNAVPIANAAFISDAAIGDGQSVIEFFGRPDTSNLPTPATTTTTTSTTTTTTTGH